MTQKNPQPPICSPSIGMEWEMWPHGIIIPTTHMPFFPRDGSFSITSSKLDL